MFQSLTKSVFDMVSPQHLVNSQFWLNSTTTFKWFSKKLSLNTIYCTVLKSFSKFFTIKLCFLLKICTFLFCLQNAIYCTVLKSFSKFFTLKLCFLLKICTFLFCLQQKKSKDRTRKDLNKTFLLVASNKAL